MGLEFYEAFSESRHISSRVAQHAPDVREFRMFSFLMCFLVFKYRAFPHRKSFVSKANQIQTYFDHMKRNILFKHVHLSNRQEERDTHSLSGSQFTCSVKRSSEINKASVGSLRKPERVAT